MMTLLNENDNKNENDSLEFSLENLDNENENDSLKFSLEKFVQFHSPTALLLETKSITTHKTCHWAVKFIWRGF